MCPLAWPPDDLAGFPEAVLPAGSSLVRIHQATHGPWWFGSAGTGRFDLSPPLGTCYLAERPAGAFIEAFQHLGDGVPRTIPLRDILTRRISEVAVPISRRLADCTSARTAGFGITGEIHANAGTPEDRRRTRAWARQLAASGFDGIRYFARHDPSRGQTALALFGPAGEVAWPIARSAVIDPALLDEVERDFGIRVGPDP